MRWLLIALLVLLQVEGPTVGAAGAEGGAVTCHSMPAEESSRDLPRDPAGDAGPAPLAIHVCPGCAMPAEPQAPVRPAAIAALPPEPGELLSPASLNLPPSPPPPRRA